MKAKTRCRSSQDTNSKLRSGICKLLVEVQYPYSRVSQFEKKKANHTKSKICEQPVHKEEKQVSFKHEKMVNLTHRRNAN